MRSTFFLCALVILVAQRNIFAAEKSSARDVLKPVFRNAQKAYPFFIVPFINRSLIFAPLYLPPSMFDRSHQ